MVGPFAHSVNRWGVRHLLCDHLRGAALLAQRFGDVFGAGRIAGFLALVHDCGKCAARWQEGLDRAEASGGRVGIPHKHAGTVLAVDAGLVPLAAAVFGHHGGLPSWAGVQEAHHAATKGEHRDEVAEAIEKLSGVLPEIGAWRSELPGWREWSDGANTDPSVRDVFVRLVFSAVVDADFLDTEAHFRGAREEHPARASELFDRFEEHRGRLVAGRPRSRMDGIRGEVYDRAVIAAAGPKGLYRLHAPTGSGKTLAAAGFGLRHAAVHGLSRVVLAVPFLSITEQNAAVLREVLEFDGGPSVVLEHHSGIDLDEETRGGSGRAREARWSRLAAENWDAPFVVTTTVRLFESLFDRRPAAMRRLHRLAGSVIVLDEVQALPDRLLEPILSALRALTEHFGATVLLASATQPDFSALQAFEDLAVREVIEDPQRLYETGRRVSYDWRIDPKPTMDQIAAEVACEPQALVICNTTADAQRMHRLVEGHRDGGLVLHLSTRMTALHRFRTLRRIEEALRDGERLVVVSTQLVEAGVDLDFPVVWRAFAPADSLLQAAGRANRSGHLPSGRLVVFDPADGNKYAHWVYGAALDATAAHFGPDRAELDDLDALAAYYRDRFVLKNVRREGAPIQRARERLDFPEVARLFQMIEEQTIPVVARAPGTDDHRIDEIVARLRSLSDGDGAGPPAGVLLRELRPHLATLPRDIAARAPGLTGPVIGDLAEWTGDYHHLRGIELTDTKEYVQ